MRPPSEIAAEAVRDELYARARFAELAALPAAEIRLAIENEPGARTELMARHLLDYYDDVYDAIPPEQGLELVSAARCAASEGESHIMFRVEKDLSCALRYLRRFKEAEDALGRLGPLVAQTHAKGVHDGVFQFARVCLFSDIDLSGEVPLRVQGAMDALIEHGAPDRAYVVRLFYAAWQSRQGTWLPALRIHQEAVHLAKRRGLEWELAHAYANLGYCYRALEDFTAARVSFAKAAETFRVCGCRTLEAKALRCVARMDIRMKGRLGVSQMELAKRIFLELGNAGEVCRTTVATMEELFLTDPANDLAEYCPMMRAEARELGIASFVEPAIDRLEDIIASRSLSRDALLDAWAAFGPVTGIDQISGLEIVSN